MKRIELMKPTVIVLKGRNPYQTTKIALQKFPLTLNLNCLIKGPFLIRTKMDQLHMFNFSSGYYFFGFYRGKVYPLSLADHT